MSPLISDFAENYHELKQFLMEHSKPSLALSVEHHMRKVFLLSCASYFENEIQGIIKQFLSDKSTDERIVNFAVNKGLARQYHTYFEWEGKNINRFTSLFGDAFKEKIMSEVKANDLLAENIRAFLEIGNERNNMVHENFLSYNLGKTFDEIDALYVKASEFVCYLRKKLNEAC